MAWFAAHPFTRTVILVAMGAVSAYARNDWKNFVAAKQADPSANYKLSVALPQWLEGMALAVVLAVGPVVIAEVMKILGGGTLPMP